MNPRYKQKLIKIIKREALQRGVIYLPNGKRHKDNFYLHIKKGILHPEALFYIGEMISDRIIKDNYSAIAGPEIGSIPILSAVSLALRNRGKLVYPLVIRKTKPDHGFELQIEGILDSRVHRVHNVLLIDDVVGEGKTINKCIDLLHQYQYSVNAAMVVVDRGSRKKRTDSFKITPLITIDELLNSD